MILVLCDEEDASSWWAADALRRRGLLPTVLTGKDLASVKGWRHTIEAAAADCVLRLADGSRLEAKAISGVLNRLSAVRGPGATGSADGIATTRCTRCTPST